MDTCAKWWARLPKARFIRICCLLSMIFLAAGAVLGANAVISKATSLAVVWIGQALKLAALGATAAYPLPRNKSRWRGAYCGDKGLRLLHSNMNTLLEPICTHSTNIFGSAWGE